MIRLLGGVLIVVAGSALGLSCGRTLRGGVTAVEGVMTALERLEREMSLHLTPLPELLMKLGGVYARCGREIDRGECVRVAWGDMVARLPSLSRDSREILLPLGGVLGQYDGQAQCQALAATRQELSILRHQQRETSNRLGRVYTALGVTGGAFLVIVLM